MTTVHQVYTIRSFRSSKDRDFPKALKIYDDQIHPQAKTDAREIAYWLDNNAARKEGKFYVCGLYTGTDLVGYIEFIHLPKERLIHFDYFVIDPTRKTAGAFYTFTEQLRTFFDEEKLPWDFISAEVAEIEVVNGVSRHAQQLIRVFRQVGFSEVMAEYQQPLLGVEKPDTAIPAKFLLLPRVSMESISKSRYLEIISAVYHKHYGIWYSIYADTALDYQHSLDSILRVAGDSLKEKKDIPLRGPDRVFADSDPGANPPLRDALRYIVKILLSASAAALFHTLLRQKTDFSLWWIAGVSISAFILLSVVLSLTDKKRLEAFKLLVSLVSKFFDR